MQVQRIDNTVDLDSLRDEWNGLLETSSANSVFLTWEWLRTWWKYLAEGRQLQVVALRHGGELIAVAPLGIRRASLRRLFPFRSVDFLGSGTAGSDYLDLIVRQGWEEEALDALSGVMGPDRMLELSRIRSSALAFHLGEHLKRQGWKTEVASAGTCPFIDLRGHSWISYLASLSGEHRYNVRRKLNALEAHFNVTFERVEEPLQCAPALELLIELHQKRWREHGRSDAFHTEDHINFHGDFSILALRRGWLRLYVLRLNGRPASAIYAFRYGPTVYFYQSGFDPQYAKHSVGVAAMALSIKSAIEEGAEEYDFLHGDESYKFHWARESRDLARIRLFPPGRRGWCYQTLLGARNRAREWFRPATGQVTVGAPAAMKG
jgi:CelD/BcsL family acetyltransferase involved in cellulose biosynthesis